MMKRTKKMIAKIIATVMISVCVAGVYVPVSPVSTTVNARAAQKYTLQEYRSNAIKSFGKTYDKLLKKNEYSAFGKQQLKLLKEIGENAINAAKSKTKIKEAKTAAIEDFNSIITLPDETRNAVIAFLKGDKSIKKSKRTKAIKKLEGMTNVTDMLSLGAKYGYEQTDRVTIEQMEEWIKLLGKRYKVYTEDEIRCLVATANLDYIDDSELFSVYKVNNFEGLKSKMLKADELLNRLAESVNAERYDRYTQKIHYYVREGYNCVDYNDIIWPCDLILDESNKERINYMCSLLRNIVEDDITKKDEDNYSNGDKTIDVYSTKAFKTFRVFYHWLLNEYKDKYVQDYFSFDPDLTIGVNELTGSKGYVLGKFIYRVMNSGCSTSIRFNGSRGFMELYDKCEKILESKLDNASSYIYNEMEKYEKVLIKK